MIDTLTKAPRRLKLFGATLAMAALAAVFLVASVTQAENTTLPPGDGGEAYQVFTCSSSPEPVFPVPHKTPAPGHVALFDAYWDDSAAELVNNPCPPTVVHVPAQPNARPPVPASDTRTASNIDIRETVIHIPNSFKVNIRTDANTPYTQAKYPALWRVDDFENGGFNGVGDGEVWVLPASNTTLAFDSSADELDPADWEGDVQFEFESVQENVASADHGHILSYTADGGTADTAPTLTWTTANADTNLLVITPGAYEHRDWFFTRPGTYVLQVHAKGHPSIAFRGSEGIDEITVASEVVRYTFHVGNLADAGVGITASNMSPNPGDTVTFTVTASNAGPDAATSARVRIDLPEGLTYVPPSEQTTGVAVNGDSVIWNVGTLAAPPAPTTGNPNPTTTATLDITTLVKSDYRGHPLKVTALIEAFEQIGGSVVVELDPLESNNTARVAVIPAAVPNLPPMFLVERTLPATYQVGTNVGAPVPVKEANNVNDATTDTLTFSLSGQGADDFAVNNVDGGAQIAIDALTLSSWHYHLKLHVSDGKDHFGNADPSIDHSIAVRITIPGVN